MKLSDKATAYHEAGHAVAAARLRHALKSVTIIPRPGLGRTAVCGNLGSEFAPARSLQDGTVS